jgi:hypothetical protein
MASMEAKSISGWKAVNNVEVYYVESSISLSDIAEGSLGGVETPLYGLRIMNVTVNEQSNIIKSPVESGIRISDNKVRMPSVITITGICDNWRGELETVKDTRSDTPIIGGVVDSLMGYSYETEQRMLSMAKKVYESIDKMYHENISINVNGTLRPKTYTISTKGRIYPNMILSGVQQLNDPEHLLVVPVTLTFEELLFLGEENVMPYSPQDGDIFMGGSIKKGNILQETWQSIVE